MLARVRASVFITTDVWEGYQCAAAAAEMAPRLPALRHRVVLGEVVGDDEIDFVQFFQERPPPAPATSATDPDAVALARVSGDHAAWQGVSPAGKVFSGPLAPMT